MLAIEPCDLREHAVSGGAHAGAMEPIADQRVSTGRSITSLGKPDPQVPVGQMRKLGSKPPSSRTRSARTTTLEAPAGIALYSPSSWVRRSGAGASATVTLPRSAVTSATPAYANEARPASAAWI